MDKSIKQGKCTGDVAFEYNLENQLLSNCQYKIKIYVPITFIKKSAE